MSIKQEVFDALSAILPNTFNVELPSDPTWPAIVYSVHTEEETGWVMGGGYDLHTITIAVLGRDVDASEALRNQIVAAFELMDDFLEIEAEGDSEFEGAADVYAYLILPKLRTRRF